MRPLAITILAVVVFAGCSPAEQSVETADTPPTSTSRTTIATTTTTSATTTVVVSDPMEFSSPAFEPGSEVPVRFTCDGSDISPELEITAIPEGASTLAIIVDDPDAPTGTWVHWVVYDIDVSTDSLTVPAERGPDGTEGLNSWNVSGYGGPCPPEGERHRYFFTALALDTDLELPPGLTADELRTAIEDDVVDEAQFMGWYGR